MPSDRTPRSQACRAPHGDRHRYCGKGTHTSSVLYMERSVGNVTKTITSRWYAGPHRGNRQTGYPKILNKVQQEGETSLGMPEDHYWSFKTVREKYINLNGIKSVLFTTLKSSTIEKQTKITYKIDLWADGNLMPFKIFKCLFPKTTVKLAQLRTI